VEGRARRGEESENRYGVRRVPLAGRMIDVGNTIYEVRKVRQRRVVSHTCFGGSLQDPQLDVDSGYEGVQVHSSCSNNMCHIEKGERYYQMGLIYVFARKRKEIPFLLIATLLTEVK
jgi:hypothetical protein